MFKWKDGFIFNQWFSWRPGQVPETDWGGGMLGRAAGSGAGGSLLHSGWEEPRCPAQAAFPWLPQAEMSSLLAKTTHTHTKKRSLSTALAESKKLAAERANCWNIINIRRISMGRMCWTWAGSCWECYLACWPACACCWSSWRRQLLRHRSRAGWAAEEETGCWSGQEGNRQCCGLLVSLKWSTVGLETGICYREQMWAVNNSLHVLWKKRQASWCQSEMKNRKFKQWIIPINIWTSFGQEYLYRYWLHILISLATETRLQMMFDYSQVASISKACSDFMFIC